jgi:hypothetical protein
MAEKKQKVFFFVFSFSILYVARFPKIEKLLVSLTQTVSIFTKTLADKI